MTLTVHHQLMLLYDILGEQTEVCSSQVSEYQQIKRLVQQMMAHNRISDEQLLQLLPEIYNYGRKGEIVQNMSEHIISNRDNIENWMNAITMADVE